MKELVFHRELLPAVERYADRVGFHDGEYHATFALHLDRVLRLTSALRTELGVRPGDRFAVMAGNGHAFLELYHAGFLGAGVVNPLNLRLNPRELAFILADSETKTVFVDPLFAATVDQVRKEVGIDHVVLIGDGDVPHDVRYEDVVEAGVARVPEEPAEDDAVVLMYTGGTTGLPKGVLLDQRAEILNLYHVGIAVGFDDDRTYLHQTPMFHAASMAAVLGIPASGGISVFVPFFDPGPVLALIERYRVNQTVMVPVMVAMLLGHPEFRPERVASLTSLVYGASPMPVALLRQLLETFPALEVHQGYGMTEASSVITMLGPKDHRRGGDLLRSAGRPLPGTVITIQDEDGEVLPSGRRGEVCVQAGNVMREYWKRPRETADAFRGGWYHTGDAGYVDSAGYVYLVDRVKDMIVSGGENVYSIEVENAISTHPAVSQVAVIGIPDDMWGEAVHAIVVPKPGMTVTAEEIQAHALETIARYKVPKSVEFRDEPLPLSGALKPLKRELRAPYWEGHERAIN